MPRLLSIYFALGSFVPLFPILIVGVSIAATLHLSDRTVAHHVSAILSKLGAPTRTAAVSAAHEAGLLGGQPGPLGGPT